MSRIGKLPISIPASITVDIRDGLVVVSGPKGELATKIPTGVKVTREEDKIIVNSEMSNLHGLIRTLINNCVLGVTQGWTRVLELNGTGYRANTTGAELNLALGFSHPVVVKAPTGITFTIAENKITVLGADKVVVGEVAAKIRKLRPADVYKAKGFKYEGEVIRRKAGKAAKAGTTGGK
ncbi:MAG: 50S ribosomal protein L6 [Candidatus Amesbacteria bacterium GW2011_GWA2_42_12]|uniref:50S ribosomal protein L6 n=1 Tax=Candidatus Amesbacteria bacterium GW2011_GWA2_42_12 TaxID=1618356 RepID=A0A0G0Y956_9BACT|nr:MAG: 50S ribosomal protein L6 [Candidatus Amesbacteria bacterium GW2011_GWA2_42_12]